MANYESTEHSSVRVALGNNEFRTGLLTVPANTTYKAGMIVQTVSGKFTASAGANTEVGLGVLVEDETNSGSASADIATRVMISGKVNSEVLKIGSAAATAVQADVLRNYSIVPLKVNEI